MAKVFVGMSGGVDSSTSAFLLKEEGHEVVGVFIKSWYPLGDCGWREEMNDAMRVAAKIGIPFLVFDAEKDYEKNVGQYIIDSYKKGETPNPDVLCNYYIKFGSFLIGH